METKISQYQLCEKCFAKWHERSNTNRRDRQFHEMLRKSSIPKKNWSSWKHQHTLDVLQKRLPRTCLNPSMCYLCKMDSEGMNHLFTSCQTAKKLWDRLNSYIGGTYDTVNIKSICLTLSKLKQTTRKNIIIFNTLVLMDREKQ